MFRTVPMSIITSFSLYTQQWYMSYRFADSLFRPDPACKLSANLYDIPLPCVQWKTPDDGQRNCPKHVEFYSKNEWKKVKWSLYRPGVAQRVGRGIALLFHDRGTRRGWVVSSTPRPLYPGEDPVPILKEAGRVPGPVWTGGKSRTHPDRPARSQSLYWLSYPTHLLQK